MSTMKKRNDWFQRIPIRIIIIQAPVLIERQWGSQFPGIAREWVDPVLRIDKRERDLWKRRTNEFYTFYGFIYDLGTAG